jgi:hypothetical protein
LSLPPPWPLLPLSQAGRRHSHRRRHSGGRRDFGRRSRSGDRRHSGRRAWGRAPQRRKGRRRIGDCKEGDQRQKGRQRIGGQSNGWGAEASDSQFGRAQRNSNPANGYPEPIPVGDEANAADNAVNDFKSILSQRRAQINSNQQLPNLPGQALYLARNNMLSAYKDLNDALPSKIGRPNKFGIPPAYFDADNEPLLDEYTNLFNIMQSPPVNAQNSDTPFNDVVDLGTDIGRAKGLDAANAEVTGRISLGLFFAETNGNQNMGNARSNTYKGSLQTGVSEDQNGQKKWAAIKKSITAFDPAPRARDNKEEARVGNLDHRLNHWTAVRDALMNAHADLFPQIPAIVKALPNPIDQMKLFEFMRPQFRLGCRLEHPRCQCVLQVFVPDGRCRNRRR